MATPEVIAEQQALVGINDDYETKFGFHDPETGYAFKAPKGLSRELVEQISESKNEPAWMRDFRLKALDHFLSRPQPTWGSPMLADVDYDDIHYFVRASEKSSKTWDDVPEDIKKTFDRLGIPEALGAAAVLLLMLVFRSVLVPVKAALGFLLTVGATFGITVWIFQEGHLANLVGVATPGPLISFLPILLIGRDHRTKMIGSFGVLSGQEERVTVV